MRKLATPNLNLTKESNHPIHAEVLPHLILPQDFLGIEKKAAEALVKDHFIVTGEEEATRSASMEMALFTELSRAHHDIFGNDFYGEICNDMDEIDKIKKIPNLKKRLVNNHGGISNTEFELLLLHDQSSEYLATHLMLLDAEANTEGNHTFENTQFRYFRGEDGYLYYEVTQSNLFVEQPSEELEESVKKEIPGQVKTIYRLTTQGPELAYMAASNTLLKRLLLEKNVGVDDALINDAIKEESSSPLMEEMHHFVENFATYRLSANITGEGQCERDGYKKALYGRAQELGRGRFLFPNIGRSKFPKGIKNYGELQSAGEEVMRQYADNYIDKFIETLPNEYVNQYGIEEIKKWIINSADELYAIDITDYIRAYLVGDPVVCTELTCSYDLDRSYRGNRIFFDEVAKQLVVTTPLVFTVLKEGKEIPGIKLHSQNRIDAEGVGKELQMIRTVTLSHNIPFKTSQKMNLPKAISGKDCPDENNPRKNTPLTPTNFVGHREQQKSEVEFKKNERLAALQLVTTNYSNIEKGIEKSVFQKLNEKLPEQGKVPDVNGLINKAVELVIHLDAITDEQWEEFVSRVDNVKKQVLEYIQATSDSALPTNWLDPDFSKIDACVWLRNKAVKDQFDATIKQIGWHFGLTLDEREKIEKEYPDIAKRCVKDPRIALIFLKKIYIDDAFYNNWDSDYGPLKGEYPQIDLDVLDKDLQKYRQNALGMRNVDRISSAKTLLLRVKTLLNNPTQLPKYLYEENKSVLRQLESKLCQELRYLNEVAQVIKETKIQDSVESSKSLPPQQGMESSDQHISSKSTETTSGDDVVQQKIFREFKEENSEELHAYVALVKNTKDTLENVKQEINKYLELVHGVFYTDIINEAGQYSIDNIREGQKHLKGHSKIYTCILMLGMIQRFNQRHGSNAEDDLRHIEDFEAIITALHDVLERNNKKIQFSNRLAKGGKVISNNTTIELKGLEKVLGQRPTGIFRDKKTSKPKTATFALEFGQDLALFETAQYQKCQANRSWLFRDSSERKKRSVLKKTVTSAQAVSSRINQYVNDMQDAYLGAQLTVDLTELHLQVQMVFPKFEDDNNDEKEGDINNDEEDPYLTELEKTQCDNEREKEIISQERQRTHDFLRSHPHQDTVKFSKLYLEFVYELVTLRMDSQSKIQSAENRIVLKNTLSCCIEEIDAKWSTLAETHKEFAGDLEWKQKCARIRDDFKKTMNAFYETRLHQFDEAKLDYWNTVEEDPKIQQILDSIEMSKTVAEVALYRMEGEKQIQKIAVPEGLLMTERDSVQQEIRMHLVKAQSARLKDLLMQDIEYLVEEKMRIIPGFKDEQCTIPHYYSLQDLEILRQNAKYEIDVLVMETFSLLPADIAFEIVEPWRKCLLAAIEDRESQTRLHLKPSMQTSIDKHLLSEKHAGIDAFYSLYEQELKACPIANLSNLLSHVFRRIKKFTQKSDENEKVTALIDIALERAKEAWIVEMRSKASDNAQALKNVYQRIEEDIVHFGTPTASQLKILEKLQSKKEEIKIIITEELNKYLEEHATINRLYSLYKEEFETCSIVYLSNSLLYVFQRIEEFTQESKESKQIIELIDIALERAKEDWITKMKNAACDTQTLNEVYQKIIDEDIANFGVVYQDKNSANFRIQKASDLKALEKLQSKKEEIKIIITEERHRYAQKQTESTMQKMGKLTEGDTRRGSTVFQENQRKARRFISSTQPSIIPFRLSSTSSRPVPLSKQSSTISIGKEEVRELPSCTTFANQRGGAPQPKSQDEQQPQTLSA